MAVAAVVARVVVRAMEWAEAATAEATAAAATVAARAAAATVAARAAEARAAAGAYTGETIFSGRVRRSMSCRASSRMSRNLLVTSSAHRSRGLSSVEPSFVARSRHVLGS